MDPPPPPPPAYPGPPPPDYPPPPAYPGAAETSEMWWTYQKEELSFLNWFICRTAPDTWLDAVMDLLGDLVATALEGLEGELLV